MSAKTLRGILGLFFFVSGFCGLLYQVVWVRLAYSAFGVITPVLSVVISVFMLGLALGSVFAGRLANRLSTGGALKAYAGAEAVIGFGALAVPFLFQHSQGLLLGTGELTSLPYLLLSAVALCVTLLPWCVAMGMTYPLVMAELQARKAAKGSFSHLYVYNVFGALMGVAASALLLIETLGLYGTLKVGLVLNLSLAVAAYLLSKQTTREDAGQADMGAANQTETAAMPTGRALALLFSSGFVSMALEVAWTRAFTPVLKTEVYSFATLLFIYLLCTLLGSLLYRRHLRTGKLWSFSTLIGIWAASAFFTIVLNDPRAHKDPMGILVSLLPFCGVLGYLTPRLVDEYSRGAPGKAGWAYAVNSLGCILGPLFSSYLLLPIAGVHGTMLLLALPGVVYAALWATQQRKVWVPATVALAALAFFWSKSYDQVAKAKGALVSHDYTATVIARGEAREKQLFVNGVGITHLTPLTKIMAHLPLAQLEQKPTSALMICFGMGTTFRSLMTWGMDKVYAVELVPSVVKFFPFFFEDGAALLNDPKGHVIVDDGRRFLKRTRETFDLVTLDPPPPVEAAGSSLLYSAEFYELAKTRMKPGAILQQWIPMGEGETVSAATRSLLHSFKYVRTLPGFEGWGVHFLASDSPMPVLSPEQLLAKMPEAAKTDLVEWFPGRTPLNFMQEVMSKEISPEQVIATYSPGIKTPMITDSLPYNEYYWLRRNKKRWAAR